MTDKAYTSVSCVGFESGSSDFLPGVNAYDNLKTDEVALFETAEGGMSRMLKCRSTLSKGGETGRLFGEKGWMDGTEYRGAMKNLPDITRPPLPPGVKAGGHGGSHGQLSNEFVMSILEDRRPLVNVTQALNMTVSGVVAHQSALRDGERLKIPQYEI